MRSAFLAAAAAVFFVLPASSFAQELEFGPGGVRVEPGYHHRYERRYEGRSAVDCRSLRRSCLYKDELGETGRGNCERYRRLCR